MKHEFKVGELCFCEFKLQEIQEMENGKVTQVCDGTFVHYGSDLSDRCFPVDIKIKVISDIASYWSDRIHALNNWSLNHPDIHRYIISKWVDMCNNYQDKAIVDKLGSELSDFCKKIIESVEDSKSLEVDGVKLFNR